MDEANSTWPFDKTPDTEAITTRQVLDEGHPVLAVTHYSDDGSWAFACGTTDNVEDARVAAMQVLADMDETLRTIADLPPGWCAYREAIGGEWFREKDDDA